jgi:hypothetical protein
MNWYFAIAGILVFVIGLVHSLLGERLIFQRLRTDALVPTQGDQRLREPHVRILWASWHLVTVMGWCIAVMLFWMALPSAQHQAPAILVQTVIVGMLASSVLVFVGTNGKHPGWAGLLAVAVLTTIGQYAAR